MTVASIKKTITTLFFNIYTCTSSKIDSRWTHSLCRRPGYNCNSLSTYNVHVQCPTITMYIHVHVRTHTVGDWGHTIGSSKLCRPLSVLPTAQLKREHNLFISSIYMYMYMYTCILHCMCIGIVLLCKHTCTMCMYTYNVCMHNVYIYLH